MKTISAGLNPVTLLTVGERDLKKPAGWVAFFDNPPLRPHETFLAKLGQRRLKVTTAGHAHDSERRGHLRGVISRRSALHLLSATARSSTPSRSSPPTRMDARSFTTRASRAPRRIGSRSRGMTPKENCNATKLDPKAAATPLAVAGRTLVAEGGNGSIAVFPAPHQFFYPLDEAYNLKFVWHGRNYGDLVGDCGFGIRQSPTGDKRYRAVVQCAARDRAASRRLLPAHARRCAAGARCGREIHARRPLQKAAGPCHLQQPLPRRALEGIHGEAEGAEHRGRAARTRSAGLREDLQGARRGHRAPRRIPLRGRLEASR